MKKVDMRKLGGIPKASMEAKMLCQYLASRKRDSRSTGLKQVYFELQNEHGSKFKDRDAFNQAWADFEAAGVGVVLYGDDGRPARFDWQGYSPISVGKAALKPDEEYPEPSNFRNRKLVKDRSKFVGKTAAAALKAKRADASTPELPRSVVITRPGTQGEKSAGISLPRPSRTPDPCFANFRTSQGESIIINVRNGLSESDQEALVEFIRSLPVSCPNS